MIPGVESGWFYNIVLVGFEIVGCFVATVKLKEVT
jgi:hypothetical protein